MTLLTNKVAKDEANGIIKIAMFLKKKFLQTLKISLKLSKKTPQIKKQEQKQHPKKPQTNNQPPPKKTKTKKKHQVTDMHKLSDDKSLMQQIARGD